MLKLCSLNGGHPQKYSPHQKEIPGCSSAVGHFHFHDQNVCQSLDISLPFHPDYTGRTRMGEKKLTAGKLDTSRVFFPKPGQPIDRSFPPTRLFSQFQIFS
jgi:hypothetical protein